MKYMECDSQSYVSTWLGHGTKYLAKFHSCFCERIFLDGINKHLSQLSKADCSL